MGPAIMVAAVITAAAIMMIIGARVIMALLMAGIMIIIILAAAIMFMIEAVGVIAGTKVSSAIGKVVVGRRSRASIGAAAWLARMKVGAPGKVSVGRANVKVSHGRVSLVRDGAAGTVLALPPVLL